MATTIHKHHRWRLLLLVQLLACPTKSTHNSYSIPCDPSNDDCAARVLPGSVCRPEDNLCSNPLQQGCIHTMINLLDQNTTSYLDRVLDKDLKWRGLLAKFKGHQRVCNSDDPADADYCERPHRWKEYAEFNYTEIRIHSQNWDTSFFNAWLLQILLSEVLDVPATIETGLPHINNSFYDPTLQLGNGVQDLWGALSRVDQAPDGDCRNVDRYVPKKGGKGERYHACAHVVPEYWEDGSDLNNYHVNRTHSLKYMEEVGMIERPQALGAVGNQGLYVTKYTAENDTTILSYLGLQGEQNRRKLAELFLRPTTWRQYCEEVSESSCFLPDDTARRPPEHPDEYNLFHAPGLYTGHFRKTEENDCDTHPDTCTGHVADFPCEFGSLVQAWTHHLNISLQSGGQKSNNQAYTNEQMTQLWDAANATRSNLISLYYSPKSAYSKYIGTPAEMVRVTMPTATQECMENRLTKPKQYQLCTLPEPVVGDPRGACDYFPFSLQLIKSRALDRASHPEGVSPALHSPALMAISKYRISHLALDQMLVGWYRLSSSGYLRDGFDPRMAVCGWLLENLKDVLEDVLPKTYPRALSQEDIYELPLYRAALTFGGLSVYLSITCGIFVILRRNTTVMKHAQVDFLMCLLSGVLLVGLSAVTTALKPTPIICVANVWLIELGYTMALVPLIVKVTAINRLLSAAKKMRRVKINRARLFCYVVGWAMFTTLGMTLWTIFDPPVPVKSFFLTEELNDHGETVVSVETHCKSESSYWLMVAMGFHLLLLMWAAVLAFQTRKISQKFNESKVLVAVIYSQCMIVAIRMVLLVLPADAIQPVMDTGLTSLCLGIDSLLTLLIYFIPKLTLYRREEASSRRESQQNVKVYGGWKNNTNTQTNFEVDSDGNSSGSGKPRTQRVSFPQEANGMTQSRKLVEEEKKVATTLVSHLETENALLKDENEVLKESNDTLAHRVEQLETETLRLRKQLPHEEQEATLTSHRGVLTSSIVSGQLPFGSESNFSDEEGSTQFFDPTNSTISNTNTRGSVIYPPPTNSPFSRTSTKATIKRTSTKASAIHPPPEEKERALKEKAAKKKAAQEKAEAEEFAKWKKKKFTKKDIPDFSNITLDDGGGGGFSFI